MNTTDSRKSSTDDVDMKKNSNSTESLPQMQKDVESLEALADVEGSEEKSKQGEKEAEEETIVIPATWKELIRYWFILGWTAFGGPAAHIGMFQKLFVEKLRWCTTLVFTELFMLGQCMPGPTSTQMGFALGVLKKGLPGGLVSGALFQGPGLIILSAIGWALADTLDKDIAWLNGLVSGLAAAGIALIASAAVALNKKINSERLLQVISTVSAVIAFYWPKPWTFPCLILLGGLTTIIFKRHQVVQISKMATGTDGLGFNKLGGGLLLFIWIAVLIGVLVGAGQTSYLDNKELHWFSAFYRTGSIIFGGGQVVLPMLYNDVVAADCPNQQSICCPQDLSANATIYELCSNIDVAQVTPECKCSWMSASQFYAGLAVAQAMPGPLFNFSAFLGAVIAQNANVFAIAGIALCWVGLFAPGIIIIFAILPFWGAFRHWQIYRRALPGLNSAAVGLIITSVFQLTLNAYVSSPFRTTTICIGIAAFGSTEILKVPAPIVVILGGAAGVVAWAIPMQ
ncbi:hypothetical protein M9435_000211 [Picochlorum sp. BPE23]|nr:hypothetical protein M9435_000211 [Picochlorum sp. BPE23]